MEIKDRIIIAGKHANFSEKYRSLCDKYNIERGPAEPRSLKDIMELAAGVLALRKLSGPGTVLVVADLPTGLGLKFVFQLTYVIEAMFSIDGYEYTMAVFYDEIERSARHDAPAYYPRPMGTNSQDFVAIFSSLTDLLLEISEHHRSLPAE